MKKILLILVCVMGAMTAMGQEAQQTQQAPAPEKSTSMSQGQWNHGLAVGAQWIARDLGFAQDDNTVASKTNENYSLDDLKSMYGSREKWMNYYNKLKKHENESGDVNKLVETVAGEYEKGAVIKGGVKKAVEKYNATHTGNEVSTQNGAPAAEEAATTEAQVTEVNNADATNAPETTEEGAENAKKDEAKDEGNDSGHGLLYILTILGLALGAIGTFLAMQARNEGKAMANDNRDDINNMQKQIDKLRAILKNGAPIAAATATHNTHNKQQNTAAANNDNIPQTRSIQFGGAAKAAGNDKGKTAKQEPKKAEPATAAKQEPKKADDEPKKAAAPAQGAGTFGEPKILFMAKPDDDDNFSRSSSQYEPGNSIFELTTMNGKSGSFTVINKTEAHKLALLMPGDTLTRACSGNNIQSTAGKTRIVTDRAGRAQLENGKWHIVVKAIVHYE